MKKIILVGLTLILGLEAYPQQILTSAGGDLSDDHVSVSWTIGEVFTEDIVGDSFTNTSGFNQGEPIQTFVGVSESPIEFRLFPNPVTSHLIIEQKESDEYLVRVYSMTGNLEYELTTAQSACTIDFSKESIGLYIIQIIDKSGLITTKKIIKKLN